MEKYFSARALNASAVFDTPQMPWVGPTRTTKDPRRTEEKLEKLLVTKVIQEIKKDLTR